MNGRLELRIITQPYSEVYWRYFGRLVFGNSLTNHNKISSFSYFVVICFLPLSHIPPCYHANRPDFPLLIHPGHAPRFGAAAISILLEPIRKYYLNIRQYYWKSKYPVIFLKTQTNANKQLKSGDNNRYNVYICKLVYLYHKILCIKVIEHCSDM